MEKIEQEIPCILFRGGTSSGPFFLKKDLPSESGARDQLLLKIMGSPHPRQVDGIGGGDSLSSKVGIVSPSKRTGVDIDFLLCQVHVDQCIVETNLNCGNMLSAAAPFAIEKKLVRPTVPETTLRVYNENTDSLIDVTLQTPHGQLTYQGNVHIDGVPGTGAPIKLSFRDAAGAKTGQLLPTGQCVDQLESGVLVSCVDMAVPMVITLAEDLGKTGYESKEALDQDNAFMQRLQQIRQEAAVRMGLGDVRNSISPKICMVSSPRDGGSITSRYFTPFDCHDAHAVSGGLCLATACLIKGSLAEQVAEINCSPAEEKEVIIEHLSGKIMTSIVCRMTEEGQFVFPTASFIRTARPLLKGTVCVF